jgi:hypothetical protein
MPSPQDDDNQGPESKEPDFMVRIDLVRVFELAEWVLRKIEG